MLEHQGDLAAIDQELERVCRHLLTADPDGTRLATVIRETYDQLLDGQRSGRWDYRSLRKTEKTHMGTLVEINLHRRFDFADGDATDYRVDGIEVDCKFSRLFGGWEMPLESYGHLCLVVWADDLQSRWSAGIVRVRDQLLRVSENRDRKRRLNESGLAQIRWLWRDAELPENLLLQLDAGTREAILARSRGQQRVDELFRRVRDRLVSRTAVVTAGQQHDAPKRVRDARIHLRPEGIVILGHQGDHPRVARSIGLDVPQKGFWISTRLIPTTADSPDAVTIAGVRYRRAAPGEPTRPAPLVDALSSEPDVGGQPL